MTDLTRFLSAGGPVIGILAGLSLSALTVILVKLWQWWLQRPRPKGVVEQALAHLEKGERSQAVILVQGQRNYRAQLISRTLRLLENGALSTEEVKTESLRLARSSVAKLGSYLRILEVIASLAPLLGLLGTVLGMIEAFQAMEAAGTRVNPAVLSGGIWQALLTTAVGLSIAIPVSMTNSWLERKVEVEAADALEAGFIASTMSSVSLEDIAAELSKNKWFQLYFQESREWTLSLVRRAEVAGYTALIVTVDVPINGLRNRAQRAGFALPQQVQAVNLHGMPQPSPPTLGPEQSVVFQGLMVSAPSWADLEWLRRQTPLPIIVKGIIHPADATRVADMGLAGVVVSNHGGRTLDGLPASISALPAVRAALGPDFLVLLDSGIRRGTDIFKAIALGANAVLVGRPQVYALAVAGALGVAHMLRLLREELEVTMALTGCPTLASINSEALRPSGELARIE